MSPHSLAHHFLTEAYQNAWANHRLLRACCELSHEEFIAPRTGFFPSIKATLNHNLTVDWYYLEVMQRSLAGLQPHEQPYRHYEPREPFERCSDLSLEQHESDAHWIDLCASLTDSTMDNVVLLPRKAGIQRDRARRILAHVFEHQIHHRGQVHAMLAETSVEPPQLDEFFCTGEDVLRAKDFAELGFDEKHIWGDRASSP